MDGNLFKPFTTSLIGSLPRSKELLMLKESSMKSEKYNNVYLEKYIEETNKVISFNHIDLVNKYGLGNVHL